MFIFKVAASDMATTTATTTTNDVSDSSDERRGVIFDVVSFSFKVGFKVSIEPLGKCLASFVLVALRRLPSSVGFQLGLGSMIRDKSWSRTK